MLSGNTMPGADQSLTPVEQPAAAVIQQRWPARESVSINPWNVMANYRRAAEIAKEQSQRFEGQNNLADALRHATWSKRMAEELGPGYAWLFGTAHELESITKFPWAETRMDFRNNAEGRRSAYGAIDLGRLQTAPEANVSARQPERKGHGWSFRY